RRFNARGELVTLSEATVKLDAKGQRFVTVGEGNGPVNALDGALRAALVPMYPTLGDLRLIDYKVRILTPEEGTRAVTRVMIESADGPAHGPAARHWATVGVSANVIDASYNALHDAITWKLFHTAGSGA
ncbi:MAG: citramalate synthase, partial [Alphaproteobacteria bacterium]|nr:citramalate synthase [Alphaproteobacteria bacterium]